MWKQFEQEIVNLFTAMLPNHKIIYTGDDKSHKYDFEVAGKFVVEIKYYRSMIVMPTIIKRAAAYLAQEVNDKNLVLVVSSKVPDELKEIIYQDYKVEILDRDILLGLANSAHFPTEKLMPFLSFDLENNGLSKN